MTATTITTAIDSVLDARRNRRDYTIPLREFSLSLDVDGDNIVGVIDGEEYVPTLHCLTQLAKWHNVPWGVVKNLTNPQLKQNGDKLFSRDKTDRALLVQLFKNGIRDGRVDAEKNFKFRVYGNTLRAMLSEQYAFIDNVWYLDHLQKVFADYSEQPTFRHWSTDGDTIHGNLLIPGTEDTKTDSEYGGMLFLGNCEIGTQRISIAPAVWRQICTNGMMGWAPGQKWSKVHRGSVDLKGLASEITAKIADKIKILDQGIDALVGTQQMVIDSQVKPSQVIAQVAENHKLTTGLKGQALMTASEYSNHESGFRNLFGIINAITRVAQTQEPAEQHRLEEVGGNLSQLNEAGWKRLQNLAVNMDEKRYNKIFGRVAA